MEDFTESNTEALTTDEVAKILNVKLPRVQDLVRRDILPHFRLGRQIRIDRRQLRQFIERGGQALPGDWRRTAGAAGVEGRIGRPEVSGGMSHTSSPPPPSRRFGLPLAASRPGVGALVPSIATAI